MKRRPMTVLLALAVLCLSVPALAAHTTAVIRVGNDSDHAVTIDSIVVLTEPTADIDQRRANSGHTFLGESSVDALLPYLQGGTQTQVLLPVGGSRTVADSLLGFALGVFSYTAPTDVLTTEAELQHFAQLTDDLSDAGDGKDIGNYNTSRSNNAGSIIVQPDEYVTLILAFPKGQLPTAVGIHFGSRAGFVLPKGTGVDASSTHTAVHLSFGSASAWPWGGKASGSRGGFAVGGFGPA